MKCNTSQICLDCEWIGHTHGMPCGQYSQDLPSPCHMGGRSKGVFPPKETLPNVKDLFFQIFGEKMCVNGGTRSIE